jgi:hypothetical protein
VNSFDRDGAKNIPGGGAFYMWMEGNDFLFWESCILGDPGCFMKKCILLLVVRLGSREIQFNSPGIYEKIRVCHKFAVHWLCALYHQVHVTLNNRRDKLW